MNLVAAFNCTHFLEFSSIFLKISQATLPISRQFPSGSRVPLQFAHSLTNFRGIAREFRRKLFPCHSVNIFLRNSRIETIRTYSPATSYLNFLEVLLSNTIIKMFQLLSGHINLFIYVHVTKNFIYLPVNYFLPYDNKFNDPLI